MEALIVLAIAGLVFVTFLKLFSTLSSRETLKKGTDILVADINDVLNDIASGSFEGREGIHCDRSGVTGQSIQFHADEDAKPGYNDACIFLGKAIQLGAGPGTVGVPASGGQPSNEFTVYTLIGLSERTTGGHASSIEQFNFFIFRNEAVGASDPEFDSTEYKYIQGIEITHSYIWVDDSTAGTGVGEVDWSSEVTYIDGLAVLLNSFGAVRSSDRQSFIGGSRNVGLHGAYFDDSTKDDASRVRPTLSEYAERTEDSRFLTASGTPPSTRYYHAAAGEIIICLQGSGGRSLVRVGSINGVLAAEPELDIDRVDAKCT